MFEINVERRSFYHLNVTFDMNILKNEKIALGAY